MSPNLNPPHFLHIPNPGTGKDESQYSMAWKDDNSYYWRYGVGYFPFLTWAQFDYFRTKSHVYKIENMPQGVHTLCKAHTSAETQLYTLGGCGTVIRFVHPLQLMVNDMAMSKPVKQITYRSEASCIFVFEDGTSKWFQNYGHSNLLKIHPVAPVSMHFSSGFINGKEKYEILHPYLISNTLYYKSCSSHID